MLANKNRAVNIVDADKIILSVKTMDNQEKLTKITMAPWAEIKIMRPYKMYGRITKLSC